MPTDKPRIQVTLTEDIDGILSHVAKTKGKSKSAIAADLIQEALEIQEDRAFAALAEKRERENETWLNHDDVWT